MTCEWVTVGRDNVVRSVFEKLDQITIPPNAVFVFDIDHTLIDISGNPIDPVVYLFHTTVQAHSVQYCMLCRPPPCGPPRPYLHAECHRAQWICVGTA